MLFVISITCFFRAAVADNGQLHLIRCIGYRMQSLLCQCQQNHTARLRNLNAGCDVFEKKSSSIATSSG